MPKHQENEFLIRKRPPHHAPLEIGNRGIFVFVTICTKDRQKWLACEDGMLALVVASREATHWQIGRFVLMPDHVHFFCAPGTWPPSSLAKWVRFWKRSFTQSLRQRNSHFQWQRDFWDTQLRTGDSYSEKWSYVRNNPVRAGLVKDADCWPYQGELNALQWRD